MRSTRQLLAFLLAALLAIAAPALTMSASAEPVLTGGAFGTVYDDFTDNGLEGANVALYSPGSYPGGSALHQTTTDGVGYWDLDDIPAGPYVLVASKAGYAPAEKSITIYAGSNSWTSSFYLEPSEWGTLSGNLTVGGAPVRAECGEIELYLADGDSLLDTRTRRGGAWSLRVPVGSYQVQASTRSGTSGMFGSTPCPQGSAAWAGGSDQDSATVFTVTKDASVKVPLNLIANPVISGVVTDQAKKPLANIVVAAGEDGHTITDANGRYTLSTAPGVTAIAFQDPAGEYLPAFHSGTTTVEDPTDVELAPGQRLTANATLAADPTPAPEAAISGLVTDSTGKPMRGVMVMVGEPGLDSEPTAIAYTRTNGRWSVAREDIAPGTYTASFMAAQLSGSMPEFDAEPLFYGNTQDPTKARIFTVGSTGAVSLGTVKLTRLASISGVTTTDDSIGEEADQVLYTLTNSAGNLVAMSQGTDVFSFTNLAPGSYKLSVSSMGLIYGGIGVLMVKPFITSWYGGLTASTAKWITVAPGAKVSGLKVALTSKIRNATKPKATGTPKVGKTLKANVGTWNQSTDVVYSYVWKRGTKTVGTKSSYKVTKADAGKKLTVTVRASHRLNTFIPGSANSPAVKVAKVKKVKKKR
ncbi:carboxypeptidase regulatory-like domain-containing protein [Nocardioides sp. Bht2]|uniref:carboxypeptidase regulatory-like domain-containing protein n=1 Tax=Nocardioides sp. Bht2 TaxID=3392297 RepID=UPI0039B4A42F